MNLRNEFLAYVSALTYTAPSRVKIWPIRKSHGTHLGCVPLTRTLRTLANYANNFPLAVHTNLASNVRVVRVSGTHPRYLVSRVHQW